MTKEQVEKVLKEHEDELDAKLKEVYKQERELAEEIDERGGTRNATRSQLEELHDIKTRKDKLWAVGGEIYLLRCDLGLGGK